MTEYMTMTEITVTFGIIIYLLVRYAISEERRMKYTEKTYELSLGFRILKARKAAGLTQVRVSEQVEGGSAISRWEKNKRTPSIHQLATLALIFGTTMDSLYGRVEL